MSKTLRETADRYFSIFIRITYADHAGFCPCYTCGVRKHWTEMDAGHFIRRGHSSVRYDENNVRPQCKEDNQFKGGMEESFEEHLREDLGDEAVNDLLKRGQQEKQFTDEEYKEIIHRCKLSISEKGIII